MMAASLVHQLVDYSAALMEVQKAGLMVSETVDSTDASKAWQLVAGTVYSSVERKAASSAAR